MKVFFVSHIQLVYSWHFQNSNLMWIWNSMKHIGRHLSEKISPSHMLLVREFEYLKGNLETRVFPTPLTNNSNS